MRNVVGQFRHLHHVRVSNVYLLDGGPGDRWLVDCGHWSERATLLWELRRAGVRPSELTGVHGGTSALLSGDMLLTAVPPLVMRKGMSPRFQFMMTAPGGRPVHEPVRSPSTS